LGGSWGQKPKLTAILEGILTPKRMAGFWYWATPEGLIMEGHLQQRGNRKQNLLIIGAGAKPFWKMESEGYITRFTGNSEIHPGAEEDPNL